MSALPEGWARLHPLSPVARGGKALVGILLLLGPRQLIDGLDTTRLVIDLVVFVVVVAAGVVSWRVTRWRVQGNDLQIESGLLRRQSVRVPLKQLQAVDLVRPFAAQVLGLSELRLVLAGEGPSSSRLAYLTERGAGEVRAQLLALAHGLDAATPEPTEQPLLRVPAGRLVASVLLGAPAITAVGLLLVLAVLLVVVPDAVPGTSTGLLPVLLGSGAAVLRRLNTELGFTVAESPDGLRIRAGLLQTRATTIPHGRVQGVRLVEPLLWRPFGWCRLEVDVAQQRQEHSDEQDGGQSERALLPVGSRAEAENLVWRVLPGAGLRPAVASQPPRRARWAAPLSWHLLQAWHDDVHAAARTGTFTARTVVVPLAKLQSTRWSQGPLQRRLGLASVHLDTAGRGWQADARDRDAAEAAALVMRLSSLARAARALTQPRNQPLSGSPASNDQLA